MLMYRECVCVCMCEGKQSASLQLLLLFRPINKHLKFNSSQCLFWLVLCVFASLPACLSVQAASLPLTSTL